MISVSLGGWYTLGSGAWGNASLILAVLHRGGLGRGAGFRGLYVMLWIPSHS
jgi:hypothetical protein